MVASHERSGTHFTMNTLAACFGYASAPWIDVDQSTFNINYYSPRALLILLNAVSDLRTASIPKTHHEAAFFANILGDLRDLQIVYVYRHPANVMASFWRFLHSWPWAEGPKTESLLEFAKAAPMGQLMRYQHRQTTDMLDRWANHVQGWVDAAAELEHVHIVRYEDLAYDFAASVDGLAGALDVSPLRFVRPLPQQNVVSSGPVAFTGIEGERDRDLITVMAIQRYPVLMRRLGYVDQVEAAQQEPERKPPDQAPEGMPQHRSLRSA